MPRTRIALDPFRFSRAGIEMFLCIKQISYSGKLFFKKRVFPVSDFTEDNLLKICKKKMVI